MIASNEVTLLSLKSLQDETKKLLDSINLSKKPKKQLLVSLSSNNLTLSNQSKKAKKRRTRFPRNSNEDRSILDLKSNLQLNLIGGNKVTVEILDADSPDVSPRERLTKKQLTFMKETEIALEDQRRVRTAELKFRSQDFKSEHIRILSKADIFVPRPGISMTDLTNEKTRLQCLEDSAREKRRVSSEETQQRVEALGCLRQAMKIQAFFRGHIGRKRAMLLYKLRDLGESTCDWIEVRDQPNGDSWFYNKISGISQWERPEEITDLISSKNNVRRLPQLPEKIKVASGRLSAVKFAAEQVLVAQQREAEEEEELHAAKEVNNILGLQYISPDDNLLAPDGYFKRPHLRETIRSALLETRFDSVSTLLADVDWVQHRRPRTTPTPSRPVDRSRRQMVSVLLPKETLRSQTSKARLNIERRKDPTASSTRDLTIREVSHPGLQKASSGPHSAANMCFGCWSAGHKKSCTLHSDGEKRKKPSETMLLCRNWELGVLRRRYRSEEIQEIFLQKAASLKYDVKRQKFMTVVEQRHPVYRMLSMLITRCNHMAALWVKTVRWANSFVEMMHSGHINTPKAVDLGQRMRDARSRQNLKGLQTFLQKVHGQLPKAPITGYSYAERNGLECLLRKHYDGFLQEEVEIMTVGPVSVPVKLYEPRIYALTPPKTIPMPHAGSTSVTANLETDGICNKVMLRKSSAAWLENLCKILTRDCTRIACSQIKSITPIADIETLRRIKEPVDSTIMFATLGRKSRHGMLDVGGLPFELLVSQLITTYFPAPYGNLVVLEKTTIGPAPTPETSITFTSLLADPVNQTYVYRPLDHILNYRKAPTISIITSSKLADEKYLCGFNRPEQTGETVCFTHGPVLAIVILIDLIMLLLREKGDFVPPPFLLRFRSLLRLCLRRLNQPIPSLRSIVQWQIKPLRLRFVFHTVNASDLVIHFNLSGRWTLSFL